MTDDILNTTQNPDELRRPATVLLTAQACEYEQRLHNLNTVNTTLEQRIHDLNAAMQAEKTHRFVMNVFFKTNNSQYDLVNGMYLIGN